MTSIDTDEVYDFGFRLKQLRQEHKLSQEGLAKKLKISKETVYRYESNVQEPSLKRVIKIAQILNTSLDYLAGLDDCAPIRISGLTTEQRAALDEFIRVFVQK